MSERPAFGITSPPSALSLQRCATLRNERLLTAGVHRERERVGGAYR